MKKPFRNVSSEKAFEILKDVRTGCLSMIDAEGLPYVTPVNAVYIPDESCLYFHCSREGRRWEALHQNNAVCFVGAPAYEIVGSRFITHYESVMVEGHVQFVDDIEEKRRTLMALTEILAPGELAKRPQVVDAYIDDVAMVKIPIETITAKINQDN